MACAALVIMISNYFAIRRIETKYFGADYRPEMEELMSRMSLSDMLRYRQLIIDNFLAACLLTMSRLFP